MHGFIPPFKHLVLSGYQEEFYVIFAICKMSITDSTVCALFYDQDEIHMIIVIGFLRTKIESKVKETIETVSMIYFKIKNFGK